MRALVLALSILALSSSGHAEPQAGAARPISEAARPYFDRGAAAYAAGAYSQAIEAFEHGQQLDPHPDFLYALAQAHRKLGDCTRAVALYQTFLATRPPAAEASRARANLERCPRPPAASGAAASGAAAPGAGSARAGSSSGSAGAESSGAESPVGSPSGAALPEPTATGVRSSSDASPAVAADRGEPWYTDAVGDALAGAGLVGLGVGTAYLIMSDRTIGRAPEARTLAEAERITASASRERQIGTWCLIGGGALTAGAIVRYALHRRAGRAPDRAVWVTPQPGSLVVSWGGRL